MCPASAGRLARSPDGHSGLGFSSKALLNSPVLPFIQQAFSLYNCEGEARLHPVCNEKRKSGKYEVAEFTQEKYFSASTACLCSYSNLFSLSF